MMHAPVDTCNTAAFFSPNSSSSCSQKFHFLLHTVVYIIDYFSAVQNLPLLVQNLHLQINSSFYHSPSSQLDCTVHVL